jgi:hypothetical protein
LSNEKKRERDIVKERETKVRERRKKERKHHSPSFSLSHTLLVLLDVIGLS